MANVTIDVPNDLLAKLTAGGGDAETTLRLAAAFSLCRQGELSTSQAARLAGLTYADFLKAAGRHEVELFPIDLEELKEEVTRGYTLGRQRLADHSAGASGTC